MSDIITTRILLVVTREARGSLDWQPLENNTSYRTLKQAPIASTIADLQINKL